ncbi:MAG: DUF4344 domain-containing metallopeptidase [Acidobacteriota bacterium]
MSESSAAARTICRSWSWLVFCILLLVGETDVVAGIRLQFVRHASGDEREVEDYLRESACLGRIVASLNRNLRFPRDMTIELGTDDGPLYDVGTGTIRIPYALGFLPSPVDARFDMVERRMLYPGAFAFAVSHEIGHALIHLYHWRVRSMAEEEELADALAVHLVLHVLDCREAVTEALANVVRSGETETEGIDSTACLRPARAERVFCWLAGADTDASSWFWKLGLISNESPEGCRERYRALEVRLETLLRQAERSSSDGRP